MNNMLQPTIDELLDRYRPIERLAFRFGRCRIRLFSNSEPLMVALKRYFRTFLDSGERCDIDVFALEAIPPEIEAELTIKPPDPGKTKIKEEFRRFPDGMWVRKRLTGMVFLFGNGRNLAIGPCLKNDNQVINFIINRYIQWILNQGALLLHAAGISYEGRGLAISGFSGMGKSTLALHIMKHGTRFLSNDRLMVRRENAALQLLGVPKLPRINPGTILGND